MRTKRKLSKLTIFETCLSSKVIIEQHICKVTCSDVCNKCCCSVELRRVYLCEKWNVHTLQISKLYTCFNSHRCCWSLWRTYIHADIHIYNCINMLQIWISDLNIQQFYGRGFYEGWHKQFFMLKGINMLNFNNISFIYIARLYKILLLK